MPSRTRPPTGTKRPRPARLVDALRRRTRTWVLVVLSVLLVATAGGLTVVLRDELRWRQVFREDFDAPAPVGEFATRYQERWTVYPDGWRSTNGAGTYVPSRTVSVHDGSADVAVGETEWGPSSAALVPRLPTYGQLYGRYSVRFRADPVAGYKVAFLLWPDSEQWPADGEVDFPEGNLDGSISAFAHHADSGGGKEQFTTGDDFSRWHVATTEWEPGRLRFLLDGVPIGETTTKVPDTSMHWVLQTEVAEQAPPPGAAGHVYIDWVEAWSLR